MNAPDVRGGGPSSDESPLKSTGLHTLAQESDYADRGLTRAIANTDDWWMGIALTAIGWLAELQRPFDAYELTELGVPDPDHPGRWGAVFRIAHTSGAIFPIGYGPSRRPSVAGSAVRIWRGVNASAEQQTRLAEVAPRGQ